MESVALHVYLDIIYRNYHRIYNQYGIFRLILYIWLKEPQMLIQANPERIASNF